VISKGGGAVLHCDLLNLAKTRLSAESSYEPEINQSVAFAAAW
jgi:hypothetical protein